MGLSIDPSSAIPPYEQLRIQLIDAVAAGELAAGSKLPTVRRLAEDLGVATNTVARSYRELESDGVIETRGRNGSFVSTSGDDRLRQAQIAADAFAQRIRHLRMPPDDALELVRSALRQH